MEFSALHRQSIIARLKAESFDIAIIGGGITGAGIALDAASRGLKVALIEKNDFAFGTSSRSTKLIHGGLRYLKQLEFGLVKEVGSERAVVHKLAPHLVIPEKMLLPLSHKRGLGYLLTSFGLKIYDVLAGVKREDQRKMLTRIQTLKSEPLLKDDDILGGALYAEYRTDDARLTIEIIKTAARYGAVVLNYVEATDFVYSENNISGVTLKDNIDRDSFELKASVVINAAGPWVDNVREINLSKSGKRLHLTKGVHIVVPKEKLPVRQAIYFNVDDGRMIFAIPRGRTTYIGTTDTTYYGDQNNVFASAEDAAYLLAAVNANFPTINLNPNDIESSWAGLRPLIHEEGKSTSQLSRKDEIFESATGLISIAGGKLTGYRKMAERVVNLVVRKKFSNIVLKDCYTHLIPLTTNPFQDYHGVQRYIQQVDDQLKRLGLPYHTATYLVENYGPGTDEILERFFRNTTDKPALALIKAELLFTVHHEMVNTLSDFFVRRTGLLYFEIDKVKLYKQEIARYLSAFLQWSDDKTEKELDQLSQLEAHASIVRSK